MSTASTVAERPQAVETDGSLSRKKRMALVMYLAVLFIVALVIVTLSLVIQIHGNTAQYNTIAEKAYGLQEKNQELMEYADNITRAYDCLLMAKDALAASDTAGFADAMQTLEGLQENLSQAGKAEYNRLLAQLQSQESGTSTDGT